MTDRFKVLLSGLICLSVLIMAFAGNNLITVVLLFINISFLVFLAIYWGITGKHFLDSKGEK